MVETFALYWPRTVSLVAYVEEPPGDMPRGSWRFLVDCPGCMDFIARHEENPTYRGKGRALSNRNNIRYNSAGYCWAFDAVRFCRQAFIPENAIAQLQDGDIMVWLDADVWTLKDVPEPFVEEQLGGADLACLKRPRQATELGFWAVRVNAQTRRFLVDFAEIYRDDSVLELDQWHSGFVFDHCLAKAIKRGLKQRTLTKQPQNGHVWPGTALAEYMDHLKGDKRKALGYSPERFGKRVADVWRETQSKREK